MGCMGIAPRKKDEEVERMNRTVKGGGIKAFLCLDLKINKTYVVAFASVYNFAKHLKVFKEETAIGSPLLSLDDYPSDL